MRQLSEMPNNCFTTKIYDIIVPLEPNQGLHTITSLFLVIDYVDHDLKKLFSLDTPPTFTEQHILIIIYNLLCAAKFVHSAGLMHRDLKPANILIDDQCSIKICDFGLSRAEIKQPGPLDKYTTKIDRSDMTPNSKMSENILVGQEQFNNSFKVCNNNKIEEIKNELSRHIGSRWYRSPEIILNEPLYNQKIDIWSLGCIIGELI